MECPIENYYLELKQKDQYKIEIKHLTVAQKSIAVNYIRTKGTVSRNAANL